MSALTTTNWVSSAAKRSWRRFSLRALFLTVMAVSIYCGWVAYRVRQFHNQARFIDNLRGRGFRIETEPVKTEWFWRPLAGEDAVQVKTAVLRSRSRNGGFVGPTFDDLSKIHGWTGIFAIWLHGNCVTDETFGVIRNFPGLRTIMLFDTAITDAGLRHMDGLPNLTYLRIENTTAQNEHSYGRFTTAAGQHIARSRNLQTLHLHGIPMDQDGLRAISTNLSGLQKLSLANCGLTDDSLGELRRITGLTKLWISQNANVTDNGILNLSGLKRLNFIDAMHTKVSRKGTEELRAHIPSLLRQRTWSAETKLW